MNLPESYIKNMTDLLGEDVSLYLDCFNRPSVHGLRVNKLKLSSAYFSDISPFKITSIPYIDNGYIYDNDDNPAKDVYYYAGLYYLQEPSAMLPANRLPINKGDRVLDLCAAPGGKATELAGKLAGSGVLYANDISASRALALLKNLELAGADNIYVTAETPENLSNKLPEYFNKILCDVPCSGEGMFRKEPSLIKSWLEKGPEYYQPIQRDIIDSAYKMLAPGGMLMYSTCTFNVKEDEENIQYFLDKYNDLELIDIDWYEGFTKGLNGLDKCVRVYPHKMMGEGHFLALIHKKSRDIGKVEINTEEGIERKIITIISSDNKNTKNSNKHNNKQNKQDNNKTKETIDYLLPALKDNGYREGIRYIRTGLMLNDSQSYAMTLNNNNYDNVLELKHSDIRTVKYLKGETLFLENDEVLKAGNALISVEGFPLGFAKNDGNGKLKNMYSKGWRMT